MKGRPPQNGHLQKDHIKKLKHKNEKTIKALLFSQIYIILNRINK